MRNAGWVIGVIAGVAVAGVASIFLWTWLAVVLALTAGVKVGNVLEGSTQKQINS